MPKPKVVSVKSRMTREDMHPRWYVTVDYSGELFELPLPARLVPGDTPAIERQDSCQAIEELAHALLDFVEQVRKNFPAS